MADNGDKYEGWREHCVYDLLQLSRWTINDLAGAKTKKKRKELSDLLKQVQSFTEYQIGMAKKCDSEKGGRFEEEQTADRSETK